jgi:hypothetical protein
MKRSLRRWAVVFLAVQLGGLAFMWIWPHARVAGAFLWGTAFVALFPGNILSTTLIEKLFWNSTLSSKAMLIVELPVMVGINALLWVAVIGAIRKLVGQNVSRSTIQDSRKM